MNRKELEELMNGTYSEAFGGYVSGRMNYMSGYQIRW